MSELPRQTTSQVYWVAYIHINKDIMCSFTQKEDKLHQMDKITQ